MLGIMIGRILRSRASSSSEEEGPRELPVLGAYYIPLRPKNLVGTDASAWKSCAIASSSDDDHDDKNYETPRRQHITVNKELHELANRAHEKYQPSSLRNSLCLAQPLARDDVVQQSRDLFDMMDGAPYGMHELKAHIVADLTEDKCAVLPRDAKERLRAWLDEHMGDYAHWVRDEVIDNDAEFLAETEAPRPNLRIQQLLGPMERLLNSMQRTVNALPGKDSSQALAQIDVHHAEALFRTCLVEIRAQRDSIIALKSFIIDQSYSLMRRREEVAGLSAQLDKTRGWLREVSTTVDSILASDMSDSGQEDGDAGQSLGSNVQCQLAASEAKKVDGRDNANRDDAEREKEPLLWLIER